MFNYGSLQYSKTLCKTISWLKTEKLNVLTTSAICFLYWGQRSEVVATGDFLINNGDRGQQWL